MSKVRRDNVQSERSNRRSRNGARSEKSSGRPREITLVYASLSHAAYIRSSSARKPRQENHSMDRSAVDQSSVKDAVMWRTIFSTYVFNTKIFHRLSILLYKIVLNVSWQKCRISLNIPSSMIECSPKELSCTCAFCITKSAYCPCLNEYT